MTLRPDMDVRPHRVPDRTSGSVNRLAGSLRGHGTSRAAGIPKGVAAEHPLAWAGKHLSKLSGSVGGVEQPPCKCNGTGCFPSEKPVRMRFGQKRPSLYPFNPARNPTNVCLISSQSPSWTIENGWPDMSPKGSLTRRVCALTCTRFPVFR